jgi:DNA-3-methyladenine glycosylase I
VVKGDDGVRRCWWCVGDPVYLAYHDTEWGVPSVDDRHIFEHVCLEGFQAGLSWITILRRREHFRDAFAGFDIERVAHMNKRSVEMLLGNDRIIRHRGKIESAINNAKRALELIDERGSLAAFFWQYEPSQKPRRVTRGSFPATSPESVAMSKDLKKRGWTFVGPTTMYAHMQAIGIVNDHVDRCDRRSKVETARRRLGRKIV